MSTLLFDNAVNHLFISPDNFTGTDHHPRHHHHRHHHNQHDGGREERAAPVDIFDGAKVYVFYVDVPGLSKSDIQVTLEDENVLVIKSNTDTSNSNVGTNSNTGNGAGKRKRDESDEEETCKYLLLERRVSSKFTRKFRLPEDADVTNISAKCENGVLSITVGKRPPPELKTKTVEVQIA